MSEKIKGLEYSAGNRLISSDPKPLSVEMIELLREVVNKRSARARPTSGEELEATAEIISLAIERFREDGDEESASEGERKLKELMVE